ncbi:hypothetical protein HPB51_027340 [Rhipicephalus microplus]|uniref:C2H2-type domain-containing protein n=1 Tax=Rhipicephalus microplus TaxID=6941 RepID=A0A9J6D0B9_RHIMP|nr:hypothetical protein HPB51_027340 [Rhipicephalus microplus]
MTEVAYVSNSSNILRVRVSECDLRRAGPQLLARHSRDMILRHSDCGHARISEAVRTTSGSKLRSFPCDQCPVVATDRGEYERHQRIHTGEKPFACPPCGCRFNQKSNMATHMRRHTGEKPFSCDVCSRQFGFKMALVKHMQEEHPV